MLQSIERYLDKYNRTQDRCIIDRPNQIKHLDLEVVILQQVIPVYFAINAGSW
ncbi:hypothetical protein J6590_027356, partial [Homalodisca vitripennis]